MMLGPGGTAQLPNPAPGRLWTDPLLVGFMVEHLQYLELHQDPPPSLLLPHLDRDTVP